MALAAAADENLPADGASGTDRQRGTLQITATETHRMIGPVRTEADGHFGFRMRAGPCQQLNTALNQQRRQQRQLGVADVRHHFVTPNPVIHHSAARG
jgi:hypothetical protein